MTHANLAGRAGRWSTRHRRTAVLGWLVFVVLAVVAGQLVGTRMILHDGVGESGKADAVLYEHFKPPVGETVLVQSRTSTVADPRFRAAITDVIRRVSALHGTVFHVRSPLAVANAGQVSRDRRTALVTFQLRPWNSTTLSSVDTVLAATSAAQKTHPGFRVEQFGGASVHQAAMNSLSSDFARARNVSLPLTLLILLAAFGALAAAGIPLLLAFSSVGATLGLVALASQASRVDSTVSEVVLLIGLAVGVDYALFYVRREREERAAGRDPETALRIAAETSGHSVLVSGSTVIVAMAGLYLTGTSTFASLATGTILVVAVAMIGSVTVLPALLSKLGDRVMKGRIPFLARKRELRSAPQLWTRLLDIVLARPVVAVVLSAGLLVALAAPGFGLHTALTSSVDAMPQGLAMTKTLKRAQAAFPGEQEPAQVIVHSHDVTDAPTRAALADIKRRALVTRTLHGPAHIEINAAHTVAIMSMAIRGKGTDAESVDALTTLRRDVIAPVVRALHDSSVYVDGTTAQSADFDDLMTSRAPIVGGFVLLLAFGILLVTFRSIVIPLKAIALNLLSLGASFGVLTLVFQHHWAESLLGFKSTGAVVSWLPMFLFVVLFGLSMDYHVFVVSRIREAFDSGLNTKDAIAEGIKNTAGVVTSAAVVMVAVFAVFASLGSIDLKQMGVGLAVAVFIDATLVRGVLLPASMSLLGDWNWYLPARLGRPRRATGAGRAELAA